MLYSFAVLEGVEFIPPTFAPHITEPRWKLSFAGTRTDRGALSKGLSNETATYFVVEARNIHGLIIPHNENEAPHFYLLMEFDSSRCPTCAIGFERAFIQHEDRSITRLNFSWEVAGENENTCDTLVFRDYPTTCNGAQIPQLDERRVVLCRFCGMVCGSSTQPLFTRKVTSSKRTYTLTFEQVLVHVKSIHLYDANGRHDVLASRL
jgi:ferredoxin